MSRLPLPKNPNDLDVLNLHQIGKDILQQIEDSPVEIPELLLPIFNCKKQQSAEMPIW